MRYLLGAVTMLACGLTVALVLLWFRVVNLAGRLDAVAASGDATVEVWIASILGDVQDLQRRVKELERR